MPEENKDQSQSLMSQVLHWILGQEGNTAALYMLLVALGSGGWWTLTVGIPKHIEMIGNVAKDIQKADGEERAKDRLLFMDMLKENRDMLEEIRRLREKM